MAISEGEVSSAIIMGIAVASAFPIGALLAIFVNYPGRIKADIVAFGSGIFFSAIAFSLVNESTREGNAMTMALGFTIGAAVFSFSNHELLQRLSASRDGLNNNTGNISDANNDAYSKSPSSSDTILIGSILDSVPESLFVGVIIALHVQGLIGAVLVLFLGNLAATLEGTKRMWHKEQQGISNTKKPRSILVKWSLVFVIVAICAPIGYFLVKPLSHAEISIILGFAAGVLMAFITEDLIPEAFKKANYHIGLSSTFGFLVGFALFSIF